MGNTVSDPSLSRASSLETNKDVISGSENDQKSETELHHITIYGATGFVARHVCEYLITASCRMDSSTSVNITLAGRNTEKLRMRLDELKQIQESESKATTTTTTKNIEMDIFTADCEDLDGLIEMAKRTKVIINCAGPFQIYGTRVVEACARTGTDYVDITGEVEWAGQMKRKYGALAAKSGSRIVSFCGFDSIPSDISVYEAIHILKQAISSKHDATTQPKESIEINVQSAKTWHAVAGMMNGGTLHTILNMPVSLYNCIFNDDSKMRPVPFYAFDPFSLANPNIYDSNSEKVSEWKYLAAKSEWINNLPSIDSEINYSVSIPFFMAIANAKIVYASAIALRYSSLNNNGKNDTTPFTYMERMLPLRIKSSRKLGVLSVAPALGLALVLISMSLFIMILKIPILGKRLATWLLPPGSGSPEFVNQNGHAEVFCQVKGQIIPNNDYSMKHFEEFPNRASCHIHFQGDPGNLVTAQCVVESALCLMLNRTDLPNRPEDGFGTPAQTLGSALIKRFEENKVRPIVIERRVWKDGDVLSHDTKSEKKKML